MKPITAFMLLSIFAAVWLSCASKESGYYPVTRALDLDLTDDQAKAGAVILLEEDHIDIRNRDLCYWDHRQVKRILRPRQSEEGIFRFPDNKDLQVMTIQARAVYPDGREEMLTELDIERLPDFGQFVLYSDNCSRVFDFSGLRPGTVMEVKVRYRIDNLAFVPNTNFQKQIPILEKRFRLEHPADIDISIYAVGMEREPDTIITISGDRREMRWDRFNIEAFEPERSMPPAPQYLPSLWISVLETHELGTELDLSSWQGIADWYDDLSRSSMKCGRGIGRLVAEEKLPGRSDEEVARAIFHRVQRDFRYVAIYFGLGGLKPHEAEKTVEKLYGDCKDQSVVLATALREAGIESRLVSVRTASVGRFENPQPSVGYFNHVIVRVDLPGGSMFLDPTCKTCSFGVLPHVLQGAHGLVIGEEGAGLIVLPFGGVQKNRFTTNTAIRINDNGEAVLCDTLRCSGYFSEIYRNYFENREGQTPEKIAKKLFLDDYPFAEIVKFEMRGADPSSDCLVMQLEAWIPEYAEDRQTLFLKPAMHRAALPEIETDDRKYPLHLGVLHELRYETVVELPDGWILDGLPESLVMENDFLRFAGTYDRTERGFRLLRMREIRIDVVPTDVLLDIEEAARSIRKFEESKVLIQKM